MKTSYENGMGPQRIIKKCHLCGHLIESTSEVKQCPNCHKSFLPSNYLEKVRAKNAKDFKSLYSTIDEMHEEDLVKGIHVLW